MSPAPARRRARKGAFDVRYLVADMQVPLLFIVHSAMIFSIFPLQVKGVALIFKLTVVSEV